jgi:hypothetical protein
MPDDWESIREGKWATTRGDTITLVNPRGGLKLYALKRVGDKRPTWHETLKEAKHHG